MRIKAKKACTMNMLIRIPQLAPRITLAFVMLLLLAVRAEAELRLPAVFGDHMVLQRDVSVPVWGLAKAGDEVTVSFGGQTKTATATKSGKWMVKLDPLAVSREPRELVVETLADRQRVTFTDVLVGDVWLAGGQSNMGSPLNSAHNAAEALPKASDSELRFFRVKTKTAAEPQFDCVGSWEVCTPESAKNFSAVAYFFAREIRLTQKCPVAILQAPWGGTDIETWISLAGLKQEPPLANTLARWNKAAADYEKVKADPSLVTKYEQDLKRWQTEVAPLYNATMKKYNDDKAAGKAVGNKPQPAQPEPMNPDPMGMPSPSRRPSTPTVNFNGMIAPLAPFGIRGILWYQGENNGGRGMEYRALFPRLIHDWRTHWQTSGFDSPRELPFLFVQLPGKGLDPTPVATEGWPWLREAQAMALQVPRTGMAIIIDIGDPNDAHPTDKVDVGQRLALAARKVCYGENIVASGPLFRDAMIEPHGRMRIRFTETGTGLRIGQQPWRAPGVELYPPDKLIGFFIAGADKKWHEAEASLDGDSVVVSSPSVPQPVAVRYGWANSPRCNLYNREGLPAAPFRTDVD